jgi:DNA replication protein DnaC
VSAAAKTARDTAAEIAFLTRALKAPTLRESVERLADRARTESWTHEEFLVACLQREVSARDSHGGEGRIRAARFPARKSLEEFDFDHSRGLKREAIAHLGTLDFVTAKDNVVFLGPPGTGKTHLATGLAIRACQAGHRVLFATAAQWVARLADAHAAAAYCAGAGTARGGAGVSNRGPAASPPHFAWRRTCHVAPLAAHSATRSGGTQGTDLRGREE